jgi:hypothetical protein
MPVWIKIMRANYYPLGTRFRTGQTNRVSGGFEFGGYLDGSHTPYPTADERRIPLAKGETFPPIRSSNRACYWTLIKVL